MKCVTGTLLLTWVLAISASTENEPDRQLVITEATTLVDLAYILDAQSFQDVLAELKATHADNPARYEASVYEWIRQIRLEPEDHVIGDTLRMLSGYTPTVMTDHHDHAQHQVFKYNIPAQVETTLSYWRNQSAHSQLQQLVATAGYEAVIDHIEEAEHRQQLAGYATAMAHELNNDANASLLAILLDPRYQSSNRDLIRVQSLEIVQDPEIRHDLIMATLNADSTADHAYVMRAMDQLIGTEKATEISRDILNDQERPDGMKRLAIANLAANKPDDADFLSRMIRLLDHSTLGTSAAMALAGSDPAVTQSLLLSSYDRSSPVHKSRMRLVMTSQNDTEGLAQLEQLERNQVRK